MLFDWVNNLFGRKSKPARKGKSAERGQNHTSSNKRAKTSRNTSKSNRRNRNKSGAQKALPYRAVSIYSNSECCPAANRINKTKFLAAHAPTLPLGGCDRKDACRCRYRHYEDRRSDVRRDTDHGLPARLRIEGERRHRKDRRKSESKAHRAA